jgi:ribonuclease HI
MNTHRMLTIFAIVAALGLVTIVAVEALSIAQEAEATDARVVRHSMRVKDAASCLVLKNNNNKKHKKKKKDKDKKKTEIDNNNQPSLSLCTTFL